jgi:hypothetical protein
MKRNKIASLWLMRFLKDKPSILQLPEKDLSKEIIRGFMNDLKTAQHELENTTRL